MEGLPPPPYDEITHMDTGWDFTCLVRWMLGADRVLAWTNLTPVRRRPGTLRVSPTASIGPRGRCGLDPVRQRSRLARSGPV